MKEKLTIKIFPTDTAYQSKMGLFTKGDLKMDFLREWVELFTKMGLHIMENSKITFITGKDFKIKEKQLMMENLRMVNDMDRGF